MVRASTLPNGTLHQYHDVLVNEILKNGYDKDVVVAKFTIPFRNGNRNFFDVHNDTFFWGELDIDENFINNQDDCMNYRCIYLNATNIPAGTMIIARSDDGYGNYRYTTNNNFEIFSDGTYVEAFRTKN